LGSWYFVFWHPRQKSILTLEGVAFEREKRLHKTFDAGVFFVNFKSL
jgi:hypothetical protein